MMNDEIAINKFTLAEYVIINVDVNATFATGGTCFAHLFLRYTYFDDDFNYRVYHCEVNGLYYLAYAYVSDGKVIVMDDRGAVFV